MESYDIANIDEVITDWYFTKNDEMDRLGLEFTEITKDVRDHTFDFSFKHKRFSWHLKFEYGSYYFEVEGNEEQGLVQRCNEVIQGLDDEHDISNDDPSQAVVTILEDALIAALKTSSTAKQTEDD